MALLLFWQQQDHDHGHGPSAVRVPAPGLPGFVGTLTAAGLAVLRLDRVRALTGVYPGVEREDEMMAASG
jgi:hypothetical protein